MLLHHSNTFPNKFPSFQNIGFTNKFEYKSFKIMIEIPTITQDTDFTLRVRAKRVGYNNYVKVSFEEISNITTKLVSLPNTKTAVSYTMDEQGRLVIPIDGTSLDCNTYGLEVTGFYNNGNWRQQLAPVFEIVNISNQDNEAQEETDEITIDLEVTLGESYVSTRLFSKMMGEMEESISRNAEDISEAAERAGRIEQEIETIPSSIPTKVSELVNDNGYQTLTQVQNTVQSAVNSTKINDAEASLVEDGGEPNLVAALSGQKLVLVGKNLKGDKGDPMTWESLDSAQKAELKGPKGDPGDSVLVGQGDLPLANVVDQDSEKAVTPKAVFDALFDETLWEWKSKGVPAETNNWYIAAGNGNWTKGSGSKDSCYLTKVNEGEIYKITKGTNATTFSYAWLRTNVVPSQTGTTPEYADDATTPYYSGGKDFVIVTAPVGATCLYVRKKQNNADITPDIKVAVKLQDKVARIDDIESRIVSLIQIDTRPYYENAKIVNGGGFWANGSDTNKSKFIPVKPGRLYKVMNQAGAGSHHAFFVKNNTITVGSQAEYAGGITVMPVWSRNTEYLLAPEDAQYLYCRQKSSSTTSIIPQVFECRLLEDVDKYSSERALLQQARMVKMSQYTDNHKIKYSQTTALCLLHASDIHGDFKAKNELLAAMERYGDLIDDCLMTGDVVDYYAYGTDEPYNNYPNGYDWWQRTGLPEKMLFTLGNHDGARIDTVPGIDTKDKSAAWDGCGKEWDFDNYFADYAQNLGYVFPEGYDDEESVYYKSCFWYKDYPTQGIRLIGLDVMHIFDGILINNGDSWTIDPNNPGLKHTTDEQEQWLLERLNETLTGSGNAAAGYKVVIAAHYPLDEFDGENKAWDETAHKWVCNQNPMGGKVMVNGDKATNWHAILNPMIQFDRKFCMRNRTNSMSPFGKGDVNNIGNILEDWIQRGGEFVVWICGHVHAQLMYYPTNFPNVLVLAAPQAGWQRCDSNNYRNDMSFERAAFNYISISEKLDTGDSSIEPARARDERRDEHLIRIVRIGCKTDKAMAPQNVLCYDWKRRKVISEW